jgi:hypothetical protein
MRARSSAESDMGRGKLPTWVVTMRRWRSVLRDMKRPLTLLGCGLLLPYATRACRSSPFAAMLMVCRMRRQTHAKEIRGSRSSSLPVALRSCSRFQSGPAAAGRGDKVCGDCCPRRACIAFAPTRNALVR